MNSKFLLRALKQILKAKKKTYADLANDLNVAEISIKRIFSKESCSLQRLDEVCQALDISIYDLLRFVDSRHETTFQFTPEQEHFFATDIKAFEFWDDLYKNHASPTQAAKKLGLTHAKMRAYLRHFEEFQLIELHPRDRIKFKVAGTLNLREGGELQRHYVYQRVNNFLGLQKPGLPREIQTFTMSDRKVCRKTLRDMNGQLMRLFQEFRDRAFREERLLPKSDLISVQWLGGITPDRPLELLTSGPNPSRSGSYNSALNNPT